MSALASDPRAAASGASARLDRTYDVKPWDGGPRRFLRRSRTDRGIARQLSLSRRRRCARGCRGLRPASAPARDPAQLPDRRAPSLRARGVRPRAAPVHRHLQQRGAPVLARSAALDRRLLGGHSRTCSGSAPTTRWRPSRACSSSSTRRSPRPRLPPVSPAAPRSTEFRPARSWAPAIDGVTRSAQRRL